jgi:Dyp-type peroxidase family
LVFIDIVDGADVRGWLEKTAKPALDALTARQDTIGVAATATTAFGARVFDVLSRAAARPSGLSTPLPDVTHQEAHDVLFYVFSLSDALVADFLRAINVPSVVRQMQLERGYQRANGREVFGQRDGQRNVVPKSDRAKVAFVGPNDAEPAWAVGGSYLAYIKIEQSISEWNKLDATQQEQIIGRRADGSRVDLPAGTPVEEEGAVAAGAQQPPLSSHVRHAGPRGNANEDAVRIFRRGTPYIECDDTGLVEGLHFVSYSHSVDDFLTILERWMLNAGFPAAGSGVDALIDPARGLTKFIKSGLYFAVPHDERFPGAGIFDEVGGRLVVRVFVNGPNGQPDTTASLEGATITVAFNGQSETGVTDAAGRALFTGLPVGVALTVTETLPPGGTTLTGGASLAITLDGCKAGLLTFTNSRPNPAGGYGA